MFSIPKVFLFVLRRDFFQSKQCAHWVIGKIASLLGANSINIIDIRAPQDLEQNHSLAVIKTNVPVPAALIEQIKADVKAVKAFSFSC